MGNEELVEYRIRQLEDSNATIASAVSELKDFSIQMRTTVHVFLIVIGLTSTILPTLVAFILNRYTK